MTYMQQLDINENMTGQDIGMDESLQLKCSKKKNERDRIFTTTDLKSKPSNHIHIDRVQMMLKETHLTATPNTEEWTTNTRRATPNTEECNSDDSFERCNSDDDSDKSECDSDSDSDIIRPMLSCEEELVAENVGTEGNVMDRNSLVTPPKFVKVPSCGHDQATASSNIVHTFEERKIFRFGTCKVREYPRVLGDNVCMFGAPISISWEHQSEKEYDLDEYEEAYLQTRRTQTELKMPSKHRDKILREIGYSAKEIQEAIKKSNIVRNQRKRTVEMLKMQSVHEAFEKMGRVGKKISFRKKKKKVKKKVDE